MTEREDIREGNSKMERKRIWEANQGNLASQICSCGIKIGIKTQEQKYTSHFTGLLKGGGGCVGWEGEDMPLCAGTDTSGTRGKQLFCSLDFCLVQRFQGASE